LGDREALGDPRPLAQARSFNVRWAEADTLDGIKALVAETSLDSRRERERL
jgi:hypothetical protein